MLALAPDIVIVATGGVPNTGFFGPGEELVVSGWDVLSGQVALSGEVLVYDENGQHQGPSVRRVPGPARRESHLRRCPDRMPAVELGATNSAQFMKALYASGVRFVPDLSLAWRDARRQQARGHVQEHVHGSA